MITCANKNLVSYKNLEKRVGEEMAHYIWHISEGNIMENGIPNPSYINALPYEAYTKLLDSRHAEMELSINKSISSDKNVRADLFDRKDSVGAEFILGKISERTPSLAPIANMISDKLKITGRNITVELVPYINITSNTGFLAVGMHHALSNNASRIEIAEFANVGSLKNGRLDTIILHEFIHALTSDFIDNNRNSKEVKQLEKLLDKARTELASKYGSTVEDVHNLFYGLTDVDEFIADGITNGKFISELISIKSDKSGFDNLLSEILDWISSLFGKDAKDTVYSNLLEVLSSITKNDDVSESVEIKKGVDLIFEQNPELSKIGTQQQYSAYLDTIFPDSKVKDVVYHGGEKTFEQFSLETKDRASGTSQIKKGIYLSRSKNVAKGYVRSKESITSNALNRILDTIEKSLGLKEYAVYGSKEDGYTYEEEQYKKPSEIISKLEKLYGKLTKDNLYYFSEEGLSDYSYMNQLKDFENLNIGSLIDAMRTDDIEKIKSIISEYEANNKDTSKLYSVIVNLKNPTIISNKETVPIYRSLIGKESLINKAESVIVENVDDSVKGHMSEPSDTIIVFEPEQIHILGSNQDIEGFKEFINSNQGVKEVTDEFGNGWREIKIDESANDEILFAEGIDDFTVQDEFIIRTGDGRTLTTSEKETGVDAVITSVYRLLVESEARSVSINDVFRNASDILISAANNLKARAESDDVSDDEYDSIVDNIDSILKIIDKTAWGKITSIAAKRLSSYGVDIESKKRDTEAIAEEGDQEFSDNESDEFDSDDVFLSNDEGVLGEDWANEAQFSLRETDTSTKAVKILMWSLRDPMRNILGLRPILDISDSYRKILTFMSQVGDTSINGMLTALDNQAKTQDKHIKNNIFRQLHTKLSTAPFHIRAQFRNAMDMNRNLFVVTNLDESDGKLISFRADKRHAGGIVLDEWVSMMRYKLKGLSQSELKATLTKAADLIASTSGMNIYRPTEDSDRKAIVDIIKEALDTIGIYISPANEIALRTDAPYKADKSTRGGNLLSSIRRHDKSLGTYQRLESELRNLSQKDNIDVDTIISKVTYISTLKMLSDSEGLVSSKYFPNSTKGIDGNMHYNFGIHTKQTRVIRRLLNDMRFVQSMTNSMFTRHASWLAPNKFPAGRSVTWTSAFGTAFKDGIRTDKSKTPVTRRKMDIIDAIVSMLADFQNSGNKITYLWDTAKSDKPLTTIFSVEREKLPGNIITKNSDGSVAIDPEVLYQSNIMQSAMGIVYGEIDRIVTVNTMTSDQRKVFDAANGGSYSANGNFFYSHPILNDHFTFIPDPETGNLRIDFTKDVVTTTIEGDQIPMKVGELFELARSIGGKDSNGHILNADRVEAAKMYMTKIIADEFIELANEDVSNWESLGLLKKNKNGDIIGGKIFNWEYLIKNDMAFYRKGPEGEMHHGHEYGARASAMYLALDASINSDIAISNSTMLVSGDFAKMDKPGSSPNAFIKSGLSVKDAVVKSMSEHMKRLASDIAPYQGVVSDVISEPELPSPLPSTYDIVVVSDIKNDGASYRESISHIDGITDSDLSSKGTDALEQISFPHKVEILLRAGKITIQEYLSILDDYKHDKLDPVKLDGLNIGVGKPLQTPVDHISTATKESGTNDIIYDHTYIKSAEMAMVKAMTETASIEQDVLRQAMEEAGISRISRVTAVKYGQKRIVNTHNEDGSLKTKDELVELFRQNKVSLPWSGFGYQQDQHQADEGELVSASTQADATILAGVEDMEFTTQTGKSITGSGLIERKDAVNKLLSQFEKDDLSSKLPSKNGEIEKKPLFDYLKSVASKLSWSNTDISAAGEMMANDIPLIFSHIMPKMEAVLYSAWSKVIKPKRNGFALVQFPFIGANDEKAANALKKGISAPTAKDINRIDGIIKSDKFDSSTGLKYSRSKDGEVTIAQCMVPFKFWSKISEFGIENFVGEDGLLDTSKISPELLRIVGLRIPNQGHSSQLLLDVVGFLPSWYGDVVLVPPHIVTQMGSDFDIDKLFTYWRNGIVVAKDKIVSLPRNIVKYNNNNTAYVDYKAVDRFIEDAFKDQIHNKMLVLTLADRMYSAEKSAKSIISAMFEANKRAVAAREGVEFTEVEKSEDVDAAMSGEEMKKFRDAAMRELGFKPVDIEVPSRKSIALKAAHDAYFDIFDTVLSNADVIKKAMTPLDKDDLQIMASESLRPKSSRPFTNAMRQLSDYEMQSNSKSGVAMFSRIVTAFAGMQGKNIMFIDNEGNLSPFSRFADSNGETLELVELNPTGKSKFNGTIERTTIDNIITQQTGAVDNASKPTMYENNLNSITFNASSVLSALTTVNGDGVALDTNTRFLRQESIIMMAKLLSRANAASASDEDKRNFSIENTAATVRKMFESRLVGNKSALEGELQLAKLKSYTPSDLLEMEKLGHSNPGDPRYIAAQIDFIDMFVELYDMGNIFSSLAGMSSVNSKGMKISFPENEQMIDATLSAVTGRRLSNATMIWSRRGTYSLEKNDDGGYSISKSQGDINTHSGNSMAITLESQNLIGKTMGYTNDIVKYATDIVEAHAEAYERRNKETTKRKKSIILGLRAFLYSKLPLLNGETHASLIESGKIASQLLAAKAEKSLEGNMFIQTIQVADDEKHLKLNARMNDGDSSGRMIESFYELFNDGNPDHRLLAENILRHELLTGGSQGPLNSLKYIHHSVFKDLGFYQQLSSQFKGLGPDSIISSFVDLFFRNNPQYAKKIYSKENKDIANIINGSGSGKIIKIDVGDNLSDDLMMLQSYITSRIDEGNPVFYEYVSVRSRGKIRLYKLNASKNTEKYVVYEEVQKLGSAAFEKFQGINFSDFSAQATPSQISIEIPVGNTQHSLSSIDDIKSIIPPVLGSDDVRRIFEYSSGDAADWMADIYDQVKGVIGEIKVEWSDVKSKNIAEYSNGKIVIYNNQAEAVIKMFGKDHLIKTIAHELNHALSVKFYKDGEKQGSRFSKFTSNVNALYIDAMAGAGNMDIESVVTGKAFVGIKYRDAIELFSKGKNVQEIAESLLGGNATSKSINELKLSIYWMKNPLEFLAEMHSKPVIQKLMSTISPSEEVKSSIGDSSLLNIKDALIRAFTKVLSSISKVFATTVDGEVELNSILEASIANLMGMTDIIGRPEQVTPDTTVNPRPKNIIHSEVAGDRKFEPLLNIHPISEKFTRKSVEDDPEYMYLFTDNAQRTSGSRPIDKYGLYYELWTDKTGTKEYNYPSVTQAVIRGLDNAFPITTMVDDKRTQWTDDRFDEYKEIIDREISSIKNHASRFKGIKFNNEMQFGAGKISNMKVSAPKIWDYLNIKLREIGIDNSYVNPISISEANETQFADGIVDYGDVNSPPYPKQPTSTKLYYGYYDQESLPLNSHMKYYEEQHLINRHGALKLVDVTDKKRYLAATNWVDWINTRDFKFGAKLTPGFNSKRNRYEWSIKLVYLPSEDPTLPGMSHSISEKQELNGTVSEFMKGLTKKQRDAFRKGLKRGLFKTKCK